MSVVVFVTRYGLHSTSFFMGYLSANHIFIFVCVCRSMMSSMMSKASITSEISQNPFNDSFDVLKEMGEKE